LTFSEALNNPKSTENFSVEFAHEHDSHGPLDRGAVPLKSRGLIRRRQVTRRNGRAGDQEQRMIISLEYLAAFVRTLPTTERGASLVEYALLVALIAVVCIAAVTSLGNRASSNFSSISAAI
jgi:pilus assembly protein Flp/PilA